MSGKREIKGREENEEERYDGCSAKEEGRCIGISEEVLAAIPAAVASDGLSYHI